MAQTYHIKDLTNNADTNTATPPQGAPEGMQRTAVNNTMREMMGAIRGDWDGSAPSGGSQWRDVSGGNLVLRSSASQLTIGVLDLTSSFPIGRKVKLLYPTGNSGYAFVSAVSFGAGNTTITVSDFDDIAPDNTVRAGITNCLMASGFGDIADHGIGVTAYESMTEAEITADYIAADSAITSAFTSADSGITSAFIAADAVVTAAYIAADAAIVSTQVFIVPAAETSAAINTALSDGRPVHLKPTTYILSSSINVGTGDVIIGAGSGKTTLQLANGADTDCISGAGVDVFLSGFTVDGNSANQTAGVGTQRGIDLSQTSRFRMNDLIVTDTLDDGAHCSFFDGSLVDCEFNNCANGSGLDFGTRSTGLNGSMDVVHMRGVKAKGNKDFAMRITGDGRAVVDGLKIESESNTSSGGGANAINGFIGSCSGGVTLTNFLIDSSTGTGFGFLVGAACSVSKGLILMPLGKGGSIGAQTTISGCHFKPAALGGLVADKYSQIVGNAFQSSLTFIDDAIHSVVSGCSFWDTPADAIIMDGNVTGTPTVLVTGCTFDNIAGDAISGEGHVFVDSCTFNNVTGANVNLDPGMGHGGPVFVEAVAQDNIPVSTETVLTGMANIEYPQAPNGSRRFLLSHNVTMNITAAGANTITLRIRSGTSGTALARPVIRTLAWAGGGIFDNAGFSIGPVIVTPAVDERLTATVEVSANSTCDVRANDYNDGDSPGNAHSFFEATYLDG